MKLTLQKQWGEVEKLLFAEAVEHFQKLNMDDSPRVYHAVTLSNDVVVAYVCTQCQWAQRVAIPHIYIRKPFKKRKLIDEIKDVFHKHYIPDVKAQGFTELVTSCAGEDVHTSQLLVDLGFTTRYICCATMTL